MTSALYLRLKRGWMGRNIAPLLTLGVLLAAIATYIAITSETTAFGPRPSQVWLLLLVNVALLLTLAAVIGRRVVGLWTSFRRGIAGSQLQRRMVAMFSLIAILPTLLVALFSIFFFNLGIQAWFNARVNTAVEESLVVAEAYLAEHKENLRAEAVAMAQDINQVIGMALANPVEFNRYVSAQAAMRSINEVIVFQRNRIIAQGRFSFTLSFESMPLNAIERARDGEVVILTDEEEHDKVRALVRLDSGEETYLLVGRLVDAKVLSHMASTQGAVHQYMELKNNLGRLQVSFSLVFISLALLVLLAAIWYGLRFSMRMVEPISKLVVAAERVKGGDYEARVEAEGAEDEISTLSRTFNRMTEQLSAQRAQLIEANRRLDDRRRFTETVLGGVSAGVLALDAGKHVTLINRSAQQILEKENEEQLTGRAVSELLPGIQELLVKAEEKGGTVAQGTLHLERGGKSVSLHARVSAEMSDEALTGFIVTFDDITLLIAAQRHAAWSDVARRVAHEIKNPLTPIALAAERLKRKYLKYVDAEESEQFTRYTDTIARHVTDIGKMVDEFASFARMPKPEFKDEELTSLVRKVVFSEQVAHAGIEYRMELPEHSLYLTCDERQMTQMLSNILKNAAEALEANGEGAEKPVITVRLECAGGRVQLQVSDNGSGFPPGEPQRMLEPYVTTRAKGTGLGLAIVRKIVEDHQGIITLANNPEKGAIVTLSFLQRCDINAA